jgi:hypothetical protein
MRKVLLVDLVHRHKVRHVRQEHSRLLLGQCCDRGMGARWKSQTHLDHAAQRTPGRLQDRRHCTAAGFRLGLDVTFDQVALSIGGDLAGDEDQAAGMDGLGLWCCGLSANVF